MSEEYIGGYHAREIKITVQRRVHKRELLIEFADRDTVIELIVKRLRFNNRGSNKPDPLGDFNFSKMYR